MKVVFELSGKQHIYSEGDVFITDCVEHEVGQTFTVDRVLSIVDGADTKIGNPVINGAKVELQVLHQGKGKKVIVQKYKPKENYRIRFGHRRHQSQLKVVKIFAGE